MNETYTDYLTVPTQYVEHEGARFAYRILGEGNNGIPIVYLNHLAANLDNCDPLIMNALSTHFTVVSVDYPGIGASGGKAPVTVEQMAQAVISFIRILGYDKVHLLGLSLGGFVAQEMLRLEPDLIERVILAGTGPAGDRGITAVARITYYDMFRGFLTRKDPRYYLFFPSNKIARQAADAFLERVQQRKDRDVPTRVPALQAQLKAVTAWGKAPVQDLSAIKHQIWVVNGDNDRMVPTKGSYDLAHRLSNATLTIYEGAGHGSIFQCAEQFVKQAVTFYKEI